MFKIILIAIGVFFISCSKTKHTNSFLENNITYENEELKSLSERHLSYWEKFSKKDFNNTYEYELPYQQYLYSKKWYNNFFKTNNVNYRIYQIDIQRYDKNSDIANVKTRFVKDKTNFIFSDLWFYVNGQWYHHFKPSKLPNYETNRYFVN